METTIITGVTKYRKSNIDFILPPLTRWSERLNISFLERVSKKCVRIAPWGFADTPLTAFLSKNSKDNHRRGALSEEYAQRNHIFNGLHGLWAKAQLK